MDTEHLLLGCILSAPHTFHQAKEEGVTDDTFSHSDTQLIWQVMGRIIATTNTVDRYSILTELRRMKHTAGQELVDSIPTDLDPNAVVVHAKACREAEKTRKLSTLISRYSRVTGDIDAHITEAATELMGILHNSTTHKVKHVSEIAPHVQSDLEAIAAGKGENLIGYDSWVSGVNRWACPYPKGKTTVFAAYRNAGKSTHLKQEAIHLAREKGVRVGVITMEDTDKDVLTNTVTVDGAGFMWRYQRGTGDMAKFKYHLDRIKDLPIYMIDAPQTISDLESSMTLLVAKYGCEVILIDHLHEVLADRGHRYHGIDDKYTDIFERICSTVKRLNIGCCVYAQFSRDCEKEGRQPRMSDLKGSSKIEQAARRIYMLYKDPESDGFFIEGAKISNSGWGSKEDRLVKIKYCADHDGFEEIC